MNNDLSVWILTFNRPAQLNRLIYRLGQQGFKVNVFSNHPKVEINEHNKIYVDEVIINTLNDEDSSSWCSRSWNSIYLKGFKNSNKLICCQDDINISDNFGEWIRENSKKYDFIQLAGDNFHYITLDILRNVGYWDENFQNCYCSDADYIKRVYIDYPYKDRISLHNGHSWETEYNPCNAYDHIFHDMGTKICGDNSYQNQHWEAESLGLNLIKISQDYYKSKWGVDCDNTGPTIYSINRKFPERIMYPHTIKKWNIIKYLKYNN